ncbi:GIP [Symbiodinium sp. CCMP2456]|nr:GIP [Symbiodinium sp. CCMP2456]
MRTWREWYFTFTNYLVANDPEFEEDLRNLDLDTVVSHELLPDDVVSRSQRLYGLLCSLLRGRPLLLIKNLDSTKCGYEAIRRLKNEMEPREKARSLALLRSLASWRFDGTAGLHEQLVKYEEALRTYELASQKTFPEDLVLATVLTGMKEPLRSQLQLRMGPGTKYSEVREWILQWESLNTPWATTTPGGKGGGRDDGGARPMDVDRGNYGNYGGKGWNQGSGGSWAGNWDSEACRICGKRGHWKWECPQAKGNGWGKQGGKGKGKKGDKVQQVEQSGAASVAGSTTTSSTSLPPSASVYRGSTASVNLVAVALESAEASCQRTTEVFDLTELDDEYEGEFGLEPGDVMMIRAMAEEEQGNSDAEHEVLAGLYGGLQDEEDSFVNFSGVPVYAMDATDGDERWDVEPGLDQAPLQVNAVTRAKEVEVVIDSGATYGKATQSVGVRMQDAQGKMIKERGCRVIDVMMKTAAGEEVMVRERFAIAKIGSMIMSVGRLLRWGWQLGHHNGGPVIEKDAHKVPITLRRNTLTVPAVIAAVMVGPLLQGQAPARVQPLSTYDDLGRFPKEVEDLVARPGWSILPSGLPLLTIHKTENLNLEQSLWEADDWSWIAVFVRLEEATRAPEPGDVWVQLLTLKSQDYEGVSQKIVELDEDLGGQRDVAVLFHVDELPKDLLSNPRDIFCEAPHEEDMPPAPLGDDGGGALLGDEPLDVEFEGQTQEPEEVEGESLEGVKLNVETPLKKLKELCDSLGLSRSGGKNKVLARLRQQREILERRMTTEVARKMYLEGNRDPDIPRTPILPSARQQELHSITHQPFQSWCEHCVLSRSKQSPRRPGQQEVEQKVPEEVRVDPVIQIDYCFTFTKLKHEVAPEEGQVVEPDAPEAEDRRDQYGLCLVAAESTTGGHSDPGARKRRWLAQAGHRTACSPVASGESRRRGHSAGRS